MRLSPELEAAVLAQATKVTGVNADALAVPQPGIEPPALDCDEKTFQTQVVKLAESLGWERVLHPFDSRRSEPGQPDCIFGRTWGETRMVALELKVYPRKATADQLWWVGVFEAAGIPARVVYPDQWAEIVAILKRP